jgi:CDP-glucose 4,6-dehydratase
MEKMGKIMRNVDPQFWKGKRVFLTGHTGFKGGWLSLWLQSMGAQLYGYSLHPPSTPSLFCEARVGCGMKWKVGDVRDYSTLFTAMEDWKPEIIIHMAAQPLVRYSYENPAETYAINVMGTVNVLEAARRISSSKVIVNVTSDKCYQNKESIWGYREDDPMGGFDPYSSSKGCSELVTSCYDRSFFKERGMALASARAGNVIGGGDWARDRLVPDILGALEENQSVIIRNPTAIRPWQHVLEPLSGYLILAESLYAEGVKFSGGWNFGPHAEDARSVKCIVEDLCKAWGRGARWHADDRSHPHEAQHLTLDITKAVRELKWQPRWTLEITVQKIAQWHRQWLSGNDMYIACLEQIQDYQSTNH